MKTQWKLSLVLVGLVLSLYDPAQAQQSQIATPVQQTATTANACTPIGAQAAAGSQTTLTIPAPPGNQYIYIASLDWDVSCGTSACGAAGASNMTTTNLGGIKWQLSTATTASLTQVRQLNYGPGGMRSVTAGTAVTVVGPTIQTNMTQTINACYWIGY